MEEWNPHLGIEIDTKRIHKGENVIRYDMPHSVMSAAKAIEWSVTTNGNLDRPMTNRAIPTMLDARNGKAGLFEFDWFERQPIQGGGLRYNWIWNTPTVSQVRMFHASPNEDPAGETYSIIFDFPQDKREARIFPKMSQLNYLRIGSDQLVIGHQHIQLGAGLTVRLTPGAMQLEVGGDFVREKDGKKYIAVAHGGKAYGIPLEPL